MVATSALYHPRAPTSILPNYGNTGAIKTNNSITGLLMGGGAMAGTQLLSGALDESVYKDMVTLTVPGVLKLFGIATVDTTSRTMSMKITLDGTVVYDEAGPVLAATSKGWYAVGHQMDGSSGNLSMERIPFHSSLTLSIKSDVAGGETDKVQMLYLVETS
jgi:hypothetical protein